MRKLFFNFVIVLCISIISVAAVKFLINSQHDRAQAAGAAQLLLSASATTVAPNQNFTVKLGVDTQNQSVYGIDAQFNFNSTLLDVVSVTLGNSNFKTLAPGTNNVIDLTKAVTINAQNPAQSKLEFGMITFDQQTQQLTGSVSGVINPATNPLATITFKAKAAGSAGIGINFTGSGITTDANVVTTVNGLPVDLLAAPIPSLTITIVGPTPTPGPSVSPGASVSPSPSLIPTPAPTPTPIPTPSPSASATPLPSASPGLHIIDFNNAPQGNLTGQYPAGVANWGANVWFLSGPWGAFTTNSISYSGSSSVSEDFSFITPGVLQSIDVYNGGTGASTVTLSCNGNPLVSTIVGINTLKTIVTNWVTVCTTITLGSSNGSWTNFDNIVYSIPGASPTPSLIPSPSPSVTPSPSISPSPTLVPTATPVPSPTVSIASPTDQSIVTPDISLTFSVTNWVIAQGGNHLHLFIDDVDQGPTYTSEPIGIFGLSIGQHTLTLKLANPDHSFTGVENSVTITVEAVCTLSYDFNNDNKTDIIDVMTVASRWNSEAGQNNYDAQFDLDNDGDIDIVDVAKVGNTWGSSCP